MAELKWDETGKKFYETGIKKVVLFVANNNGYSTGVAWSGVTAINESPTGGDPQDVYADDKKYLTLRSKENLTGTIEAYMYPDEFAQCNGEKNLADGVTISQQGRKSFALCYRTSIGNDIDGDAHGYKLHIIYGASCSPSARNYGTINESPNAATMSWQFTTTPVEVSGNNATSLIVLDSRKVPNDKLEDIEKKLYGTESDSSTLLTPEQIVEIING